MKALKKVLKWIVIVVVVLVVLAVLIFNFAGNSIIKNAVEFGGTTALSVPVNVGDVDLSLAKAKFTISNVKVGNPAGYKAENMFELGSLIVDSSYGELMSDPAVIEEIAIDGINITLEQKGLTNNIQDILNNLDKKSAPKEKQPTTPQEPAKPAKKLVIKRLTINNAAVSAQLPLSPKPLKFTLAPIELKDIGNDKPIDAAGLSAEIMSAIAGGIAQAGAGVLPDDMTGAMKDTLGQAGKLLQGGKEAGSEILKSGAEAGEGLKDAGKSITEGLGGLFKPKKEKE